MYGGRFTRLLIPAASRRDLLIRLQLAFLAALPFRLTGTKAKKRKNRKKMSPPPPGCMPNCVDRTCGSDGCGGSCGTCPADQSCQGGMCLCIPESRTTTCGGRCGDRTNTCGQIVGCPTCSGERACLSNGSCAIVCPVGGCPTGCGCGLPTTEGTSHCIANSSSVGQPCTSTAECPHGQHCQNIMPSGTACIGLC
jgi:hypothetical protein